MHWPAWRGSLGQLTINLAAIVVSGTTVLAVQRALYNRRRAKHMRDQLPRAQRRPDVDLGSHLLDDGVGER